MALKQKTLHSTNKTSNSHPDFWDKAYIEGNTGWDIGTKTPIFDHWINSIDKSKNICVLGAGNGWDAINFAQKGHKVTAVDFAPSAINSMIDRSEKNSVKMNIVQLNIFDLPKYYRFFFDVVVEYTCFCAIDPIDRQKYIETVSGILKKSGLFVGYSGCPPILNVYNLRVDQKEKNCYELNKSILELVNKQKINNLIFISKWVYYTDGDHRGANLNALSLEPRRSSNETLSKEAFTQGLMSTIEEYKKIGKKVFIVEQAPFQTFNPKQIYYGSLKDLENL